MQVWDELSDAGIVLPAVAVDDTHRPRDLFKGWTMIAAKDASPASLLKALKRGEFYATQGKSLDLVLRTMCLKLTSRHAWK